MRRQKVNRGRWQVERERHQLTEHFPGEGVKDLVATVASLIPAALGRVGLHNESWQRQIETKWTDIVGKVVAEHARPGRYYQGTLVIFVDSSPWLSELSRIWQKRILLNLQKEFTAGKIKAVRFQMDPEGDLRRPGAR